MMISSHQQRSARKNRNFILLLESVCILLLIVVVSVGTVGSAQPLQEEGDGDVNQEASGATNEERFRNAFHRTLVENPMTWAPEIFQPKDSLSLCQVTHITEDRRKTECFDANDQEGLIQTQLNYALQAQIRSQHLNFYRHHFNGRGQSDNNDGNEDEHNEPPIVQPTCYDVRPQSCPERAAKGECQDPEHMLYMHAHCPVSCGTCHNRTKLIFVNEELERTNKDDDDDDDENDDGNSNRPKKKNRKIKKSLQQQRREDENFPFSKGFKTNLPVKDAVGSDLGVPQLLDNIPYFKLETEKVKKKRLETRKASMQIIEEARDYMHHVRTDDFYKLVRETCRNKEPRCTLWALQGECEDNSEYMRKNCAPMCESCEELHYETRCPVNPNEPLALYSGDLNKMYQRILSTYQLTDEPADPNNKNNITIRVISRPDLAKGDTEETADYEIGGPWMVVFDNFASPEECEALIEEGAKIGYERSQDVGDEDETGEVGSVVSTGRTSTNAWCDPETCETNPLVDNVVRRIETVTGIHRNHSEQLQLLKYEPGQFYEVHHDFIENERYRVTGVRILTLFIYLNDVEEGGATEFPEINIRVYPRRGSALLWPSVLNDDPNERDDLTMHQANPVLKGIKYGANAWLHQRQARRAALEGC